MKLHTVLLAHNEIQDLGEIHPNILQLLQHLDLSNNQLKEILYKKHLSKSRMLKTLDVSFNNITYVEDCAFCNTSLRTLNFAFNGMRSLNPDMVNYVSKYVLKSYLFQKTHRDRFSSYFPPTFEF